MFSQSFEVKASFEVEAIFGVLLAVE